MFHLRSLPWECGYFQWKIFRKQFAFHNLTQSNFVFNFCFWWAIPNFSFKSSEVLRRRSLSKFVKQFWSNFCVKQGTLPFRRGFTRNKILLKKTRILRQSPQIQNCCCEKFSSSAELPDCFSQLWNWRFKSTTVVEKTLNWWILRNFCYLVLHLFPVLFLCWPLNLRWFVLKYNTKLKIVKVSN